MTVELNMHLFLMLTVIPLTLIVVMGGTLLWYERNMLRNEREEKERRIALEEYKYCMHRYYACRTAEDHDEAAWELQAAEERLVACI